MEIMIKRENINLHNIISNWMNNIRKIEEFRFLIFNDNWGNPDYTEEYGDSSSPFCYKEFWKEPGYYPINEILFFITDDNGSSLNISIPLDGITGPHAQFFNRKDNSCSEGDIDLSIIDVIRKLIERFPKEFFHNYSHAASYYAVYGDHQKTLHYTCLAAETDEFL